MQLDDYAPLALVPDCQVVLMPAPLQVRPLHAYVAVAHARESLFETLNAEVTGHPHGYRVPLRFSLSRCASFLHIGTYNPLQVCMHKHHKWVGGISLLTVSLD